MHCLTTFVIVTQRIRFCFFAKKDNKTTEQTQNLCMNSEMSILLVENKLIRNQKNSINYLLNEF